MKNAKVLLVAVLLFIGSLGISGTVIFGAIQGNETSSSDGDLTVFKYYDTNENGVWDNGEQAIEEWEFQLWKKVELEEPPWHEWVYVESMETGEDGCVVFEDLAYGHYKVREYLPTGWTCTNYSMEDLDEEPYAEESLWVDCPRYLEFGNILEYGDLEVCKYYDWNMNGVYDEEDPIEDWTFYLWEADENGNPVGAEPIDSGMTGEEGCYVFEDLEAGMYAVQEIIDDYWYNTEPLIQSVEVVAGETAYLDFGNVETADLEVCKYHDLNMNGVWDEGEPGLQDWEFCLWEADEEGNPIGEGPIDCQMTGENGCYIWENLMPGNYAVQEIAKEGWHNTTELIQPVELEPDSHGYLDFGNVHLASLEIYKFYDHNGDGMFNGDDYMIEDWGFIVYGPEMEEKYYTDENGKIVLDNLMPGTYYIEEEMYDGWYDTNGTGREIYLGPGETHEAMFGNAEYASVTIYKFVDDNKNGVMDEGEDLLDEEVFFNGAGEGGFFFEDFGITGEYSFNDLAPGEYTISENLPEGWYPTTPIEQSETLSPGEHWDVYFGNVQGGDLETYKFADMNSNGEYEPRLDEYLLDGIYFQLWSADEECNPIEKIGDPVPTEDGMVVWEGLSPGYYAVEEQIEIGDNWCPTTDTIQCTYVEAGETGELWFGNAPSGSITGMKFKDVMADGVFDVGVDQPLMNWQINLWTVDEKGDPDEIVQTADTNRCGEYSFNVCPGEYYVQEVMQDGWYNVTPELVKVTVEPNGSVVVDFANCMYKEIYGIKFYDYNMNGVYDEDDWVLPGWDIILKDSEGNPIERTKTEECGYYFFEGLTVGDYIVEEVVPEGWDNTTPSSVDVTITCCNSCKVVNFGNYEYADITIMKFNDENMNGMMDEDEFLVDEEVFFNGAGAGGFFFEDFGITGQYEFNDVEVGDYTLTENVPEGWTATTPTEQSNTLGPGDHWYAYFGNVENGDIRVCKFYDCNDNGVYDETEEMLSNWTMHVMVESEDDGYEIIREGVTGEDGCVLFEDLSVGTYYIHEVIKDGWYTTTGNMIEVEVVAGEESEVWIGNKDYGNIRVWKYQDLNSNGEHDEGEPFLSDWQFDLYEYEGDFVESGVTNEDGYYLFEDLVHGEYWIEETMKEGWVNTTSAERYLILEPGETRDVYFGNVENGDIRVCKFYDCNDNGVYDEPEEMLSDWTMQVMVESEDDGYEIIREGVTGEDGCVLFEDLPFGTYYIHEVIKDGWYTTTGNMIEVEVVAGEESEVWIGNKDYGHIRVWKYYDMNYNGVRDKGEPFLSDWQFDLYEYEGDWVETGVTNEDGYYLFEDLKHGEYWIEETMMEEGWFNTTSTERYLILGPGETRDIYFGNVMGGDIEGYKYCDFNMNQEFDEGEDTLEGWTINLWTTDGEGDPEEIVRTTETDENGYYEFTSIRPGDYYVQEVVEDEWYNSTPALVKVTIDPEETEQVNFGNYRHGDIWGLKYCDVDMDGEFDVSLDKPLVDWKITLWSVTNAGGPDEIIATDYTDNCGIYKFEDLEPGYYYVQEELPEGWHNTTPTSVMVKLGCVEEEVVHFGNWRLGEITVFKYYDENQNGMYDDGIDWPIEDWQINIWSVDEEGEPDEIIATGYTCEMGYYTFTDLLPGHYYVQDVLPEGWYSTTGDLKMVTVRCCCVWVEFGNYYEEDNSVEEVDNEFIMTDSFTVKFD